MSKTVKVIYSKTFEMPGFWEKIGFEIEPEKGEVIEIVLDNAKKTVQSWHEKNNSEFYKQMVGKEIRLKPNPDIVILKKYENAVKVGDEKIKNEIEANYNI
jgi:hypothetical protein